MITPLTYMIESDGEGNYLIALTSESQRLLPVDIADDLSSFAVSINVVSTQLVSSGIDTVYIVGELICKKLQALLDAYWDLKVLGIPSITFIGTLRKVADVFKNRNILIYTTGTTCSAAQATEIWLSNISEATVQKFTFLGACTDGISFSTVTTEVAWASDWLVKYGALSQSTPLKTPHYDLDLRMKQWYRNDKFRASLQAQAKQVIDEFVVSSNFNMFIPGYLVLPAYHVLRYKKATDLLEEKFSPEFIMTLPMFRSSNLGLDDSGSNIWTIMFPVCGRVTKNTLRKKKC
jgi:hypothetical protein